MATLSLPLLLLFFLIVRVQKSNGIVINNTFSNERKQWWQISERLVLH